jgi:phospholipid/cholesterol/gamma-HCH transport system substrate-binding protein
MKNSYLEFFVGLFLALGLLALAYLSVGVAREEFFATRGYEVHALFSNIGGLRTGSSVMIAGVDIGRVKTITLHEYEAKVSMVIQPEVELHQDAYASIRTKGLIGEKFIEITPGGAEEMILPGGTIINTEPAMDIEGLISRFVHGNVSKQGNTATPTN